MARRSRGLSPHLVSVLLVAAVSALALAIATGASTAGRRDATIRLEKIRPIETADDGFVSSRRCQACHPSEYESWYASFHRTMTQMASPERVVADFDGVEVRYVQGRPMRLERRGAEFWAEFDDPDGGIRAPRITRQIVMMTGSHQQQVYWYPTGRGRLLGQIPGTYLIKEERWVPRQMVFLRPPQGAPPSTTGQWNSLCINCHATHGKPLTESVSGSSTAATTVAEMGIACEACHGPGDEHARVNQSPLRRYALHLRGGDDSSVVQPMKLDARKSSQVCGQCHGVWMHATDEDERRANAEGLSYRPGADVFQSRFFVQPSTGRRPPRSDGALDRVFWSDGMVRVSGREFNGLVDSPCFVHATDPTRTLSCSSCHTMHKEPTDRRGLKTWAATHQVGAGKETNEACLQCHDSLRRDVPAHTKHAPDSSGSSCYNCHMPYTSYGLLRALRSHQISSPTAQESVRRGRPNACNGCHLDKTLEWTANHLEDWFDIEKPALSNDQATVATSVLWSLKGDAGQRALTAWAMGWKPAQEASGTGWIVPYVAGLLNDPYDAVRFIAYRSMRTLPGHERFDGDFLDSPAARQADVNAILKAWQERGSGRTGAASLLINPDGSLDRPAINRLLTERDNRPISLNE